MIVEVQSPYTDSLSKRLQDQIRALDLSAIVAFTDEKGFITYANPKFCELSEYSEDELIGQTHSLINSGYHDASFFKNFWQTIKAGSVWRGEICNRAKSGRLYWVDTTIIPFKNSDLKIYQYVAIRYDITEKKKTELELEIEKKRLIEAEKMASIGVLAAGIAHELGNPMGAIRGRLEMLESMLKQGEEFQAEFARLSVEKMIQSVDRMTRIIRGLKSYSRDGRKDEKQNFNLSQLFGDILEMSFERCQKYGIRMICKGLDQDIFIHGRETELGQVVVNLFNNAFDAVKSGHEPWVSIEAIEGEEDWTFLFKDSGPGVAKEILTKIFDPFFTTKDVGQGTGLGLSLCLSFVKDHGGSLVFDTEQDSSCFKMTLPKIKKL